MYWVCSFGILYLPNSANIVLPESTFSEFPASDKQVSAAGTKRGKFHAWCGVAQGDKIERWIQLQVDVKRCLARYIEMLRRTPSVINSPTVSLWPTATSLPDQRIVSMINEQTRRVERWTSSISSLALTSLYLLFQKNLKFSYCSCAITETAKS